jgi:DNA repair ATPase RecN
MQTIENKIIARFKIYDKIVCLNDGFLYQLQHCPYKRTKVFRKLTFNAKRNAWYINGQLVTRKRLENLKIKTTIRSY